MKSHEAVKKAAEEAAKKAAEEAAKKAAEEAAAKKAAEEAAKKNNSSSSSSNRNNSSNSSSSSSNSSSSNSSSSSSGSSSSSSSNSSSSSSSSSSPSYSADKGSIIVNAAYSQIGVPYVWGGTTPGVGLDCSGLVQYCYRQAGISIPRTSGDILAKGTIVSNPQPGDICWTSGHVAIYIGGGQMIEAQQTGVPVKVSSVRVTYYVRY